MTQTAKAKEVLQITPLPGYPDEIGRALQMLEEMRQRTKRALAGIEAAAIDWASPCIDNTIGTLLYHIAAIELDWLYSEVLENPPWPAEIVALFPYDVRDAEGRLTEVKGVPLAEHLHRLDFTRNALLTAFQSITLTDFRRLRIFEHYEVTPEWVLHHLMQHEAEHRGQIMEARRLAEKLPG